MSMMFTHVNGEDYDPYIHVDDNTDTDERDNSESDEDN